MRVVVVGALYGALAVGLGAIGAHALDSNFVPQNAEMFDKAVFYQLIHALAMVAIGGLKDRVLPVLLGAASWAFGLGVLLFSGSLYLLALGGPADVMYATPIGGVLLLLGWLILAVAAARRM
ncbi:DUF423 domain-containing protein [Acuticoccus sediminis]|uniref:DUF423 domain-containing protein n=1 Tax=Acuticoccus sediminis TaxID=2184697 RepID=A0A8B2NMJ1_9HYPH|nr:DUF423 domain-containing protein [Acuticoccus sediminis]RAH97715.1 DUF423 domain-containing protein [Acuticoccus sediminis]